MQICNKLPRVLGKCSVPAPLIKVARVVKDIVMRIIKIANEVFYFFVPCMRKEYEVFLVSQSSKQYAHGNLQIAHKFLRRHLSYQYNPVVKYIDMTKINLGDYSGKRIIHVMEFGMCTEEPINYASEIGQFILKVRNFPKVKFLSLFTTDNAGRTDDWKAMDDSRQAYRYVRPTQIDYEAKDKFFGPFPK